MPTPGSLWQALDETIAAAVAAQMGSAGSYPDRELDSVMIGETWTPDRWTLPAALVLSSDSTESPAGAGMPAHIVSRYDYALIVVDEADNYTAAKAAAQTQRRRAVTVIRNWPALIASAAAAMGADNAEQPTRLIWRRSQLQIRGRQGTTAGRHLAIAVLYFSIETNQ